MSFSQLHSHMRQRGWLFTVAGWLAVLIPFEILAGRAPCDIGFSIIAVLFLAHSARTRDWAWLKPTWVRLLALLWVYMCANAFFAEDIKLALTHSLIWLRFPVAACALAFWLLRDEQLRRALLACMGVTLVLLVADGFFQYAFHVDVVGREIYDYGSIIRLSGPFSSPRLGITLVWLTLPASAWLLSAFPLRSLRGMAGLALMALTIALVYVSGERMALIFLFFVCGLWFLLSGVLRWRVLLALVLAAPIIVGLSWSDVRLTNRQLGNTKADVAHFQQSPYGQVWQSAIDMIREKPVFGVGAKHFQISCMHHYGFTEHTAQADTTCPLHAHNLYLEWGVSFGAVGVLLLLLVCWHWVVLAWKARTLIMRNAVCCALLTAVFIRFWPIASTASSFASWSAVPMWLCIGWLLAEIYAREDAHADRAVAGKNAG